MKRGVYLRWSRSLVLIFGFEAMSRGAQFLLFGVTLGGGSEGVLGTGPGSLALTQTTFVLCKDDLLWGPER